MRARKSIRWPPTLRDGPSGLLRVRRIRCLVPAEQSERACASGARAGTQRKEQRSAKSVAIRRVAPGSRVSLRSPGTRERGPRACAPISCPGRAERAHLRERSESRDPARKAAKRDTGGDPSCGPWVPGLAALARDTGAVRAFRFAVSNSQPSSFPRRVVRPGGVLVIASIPEWRGGRSADRRTISFVALVRRDGSAPGGVRRVP